MRLEQKLNYLTTYSGPHHLETWHVHYLLVACLPVLQLKKLQLLVSDFHVRFLVLFFSGIVLFFLASSSLGSILMVCLFGGPVIIVIYMICKITKPLLKIKDSIRGKITRLVGTAAVAIISYFLHVIDYIWDVRRYFWDVIQGPLFAYMKYIAGAYVLTSCTITFFVANEKFQGERIDGIPKVIAQCFCRLIAMVSIFSGTQSLEISLILVLSMVFDFLQQMFGQRQRRPFIHTSSPHYLKRYPPPGKLKNRRSFRNQMKQHMPKVSSKTEGQ